VTVEVSAFVGVCVNVSVGADIVVEVNEADHVVDAVDVGVQEGVCVST
jgi:hypothetical protein